MILERQKSALILTWSGFKDQELVYPYYRLKGAGFKVQIVAESRDDKNRIYGIFGLNMPCDILWSEFYALSNQAKNDHELIVLPGGVKALEKLRQESQAISFIAEWGRAGRLIASTCHGAQLLISADLVRGRQVAAYYSLQIDIENAGGIYSRNPVVVDGNIVSSPHYDFMGEWMETVLDCIKSSRTN